MEPVVSAARTYGGEMIMLAIGGAAVAGLASVAVLFGAGLI
jgi:hypothetical protein